MAAFAEALAQAAETLAGANAWRGQDGRAAAALVADLQASSQARQMAVTGEDSLAILRQLLAGQQVRVEHDAAPADEGRGVDRSAVLLHDAAAGAAQVTARRDADGRAREREMFHQCPQGPGVAAVTRW